MRTGGLIVLCLLASGCASKSRDSAAEARGYERGYQQAVKEQYWHLQDQQHLPSRGSAHNTQDQ